MKRGDIVLVRFSHPSGQRGKRRPAVVIQSDAYGGIVNTLVLAEITTNLSMAADPACVFIDSSIPEGKATGLISDSVVTCLVLSTIDVTIPLRRLGALSPGQMQMLDSALKVAFALP